MSQVGLTYITDPVVDVDGAVDVDSAVDGDGAVDGDSAGLGALECCIGVGDDDGTMTVLSGVEWHGMSSSFHLHI